MGIQVLEQMPTAGKVGSEVIALSAIAGTLMDKLPLIAAGVAIVWHGLLIYDWAANKWGRRKGDNNNKKD